MTIWLSLTYYHRNFHATIILAHSNSQAEPCSDLNLRWSVLCIVCCGYVVGHIPGYTSPVTIGVLIDYLALSTVTAGTITSLEIGGTALSTLALSPYITRLSLRKLAVSGCIIAAIAQTASILPHNVFVLAILRTVVGIGAGCTLSAATAVIATSSNPDAFFGKIFAFQNFLFAILLSFLPLAAQLGQRGYFLSLGLFLGGLTLVLHAFPENPGQTNTAHNGEKSETTIPIEWFKVFLLAIVFMLFYMTVSGVYAYLERKARSIGIEPADIGYYLGLFHLMGIFGAATTGWLATRVRRIYPMSLGMLLTSVVCFLLLRSSSEFSLIVFISGFGFIILLVSSYLMGAASSLDRSGRLAVAAYGMLQISVALGPVVYGKLLSLLGSFHAISFVPMLGLLIATVIVLSLLLSLNRNEPN